MPSGFHPEQAAAHHLNERDGFRLTPTPWSASDLEAFNRDRGLKRSRRHRAFEEEVEVISSLAKPGPDRMLSWLLHPDERVPIHLFRERPDLISSGPRLPSLYAHILVHRALSDVETSGEHWTPLLDVIGERFSYYLPEGPLYQLLQDPSDVAPRSSWSPTAFGGGGGFPLLPKVAKEHSELSSYHEATLMGPATYHDHARSAAETFLGETGADVEALRPHADRFSPFFWSMVSAAVHETQPNQASSELSSFLASRGADLLSFGLYPPTFFASLRNRPDAVDLERAKLAHLLSAYLPPGVDFLKRLSTDEQVDDIHLPGSPAQRLYGNLSSISEYLASHISSFHHRRARARQSPSGAVGSVRGDRREKPSMVLDDVLERSQVDDLLEVLDTPLVSDAENDPLPFVGRRRLLNPRRIALDLLCSFESLVTPEDFQRVLQANPLSVSPQQGDSEDEVNWAITLRRSLRKILYHPSADVAVKRELLERTRSPDVRQDLASDPDILEDQGLLKRLMDSRSRDVQVRLVKTLVNTGASPEQFLRAFRSFIRSNPDVAMSILESEQRVLELLRSEDLARLLASEDSDVREKAFTLMGQVSPPEPQTSSATRSPSRTL